MYVAMAAEGLEHWIMISLERVPCAVAKRRERFWMRMVGGIWNKFSGKWRSARWRCLRGPLRGMNKGERKALTVDAHRVIQSKRGVFKLKHEMWLLRHGKDCLPPQKYTQLLQRVRFHVRREVGIHLPTIIPVPYAVHNQVDLTAVKQMTGHVFTALKLPPCVVAYLETTVRFVGKRRPTVSDLLRDKQPTETWDEMRARAEGTCKCPLLPDTIPKVEGCCVARDRDSLREILGEYSPVLDQNASNCTFAWRGTRCHKPYDVPSVSWHG